MKYLRFQRLNGTVDVYPRAHLRWIELVDEQTVKFGFSSEFITLTGRNLGKLVNGIVTGKTEVITQIPEHQLASMTLDIWVESISSQPPTPSK